MKKTFFIFIIFVCFLNSFSLDLDNKCIDPKLYKKAFIKINLRRAYIYKSFKNFPKAYEAYQKLIKFDPSKKDYYNFLIDDLKKYQKKYDLFKDFDGFLNYTPNETDRYTVLYKKAKTEKDLIKKIELFKAALREKKDDVLSIKGIADAYYKLKRPKTALKWLDNISKKNENNIKVEIDLDTLLKKLYYFNNSRFKNKNELFLTLSSFSIDYLSFDYKSQKQKKLRYILENNIKVPLNQKKLFINLELLSFVDNNSLDNKIKTLSIDCDISNNKKIKTGRFYKRLGNGLHFDTFINGIELSDRRFEFGLYKKDISDTINPGFLNINKTYLQNKPINIFGFNYNLFDLTLGYYLFENYLASPNTFDSDFSTFLVSYKKENIINDLNLYTDLCRYDYSSEYFSSFTSSAGESTFLSYLIKLKYQLNQSFSCTLSFINKEKGLSRGFYSSSLEDNTLVFNEPLYNNLGYDGNVEDLFFLINYSKNNYSIFLSRESIKEDFNLFNNNLSKSNVLNLGFNFESKNKVFEIIMSKIKNNDFFPSFTTPFTVNDINNVSDINSFLNQEKEEFLLRATLTSYFNI